MPHVVFRAPPDPTPSQTEVDATGKFEKLVLGEYKWLTYAQMSARVVCVERKATSFFSHVASLSRTTSPPASWSSPA